MPKHGEGCECRRCAGLRGAIDGVPFEAGNVVSLKHGATSERRISRRATREKRRALRQIGLRQSDLEALGRTLLQHWARRAAVLSLLDEYAEREGWIDDAGKPHGFATLYVQMLNAERRALKDLGVYLRERQRGPDPLDVLIEAGRATQARRAGLNGGAS
jgi:hypothetical protein